MQSETASIDLQPNEPKPRRFRFSILTILLVTAIVGLSLAYFRSRSELLDTQAELNQVRTNYQLLDIQDESRIYVKPLRTPADKMWQWRVHLPEGDQYKIRHAYNSVPPGAPNAASRSYLTLSPGTYVITQMFVFDPNAKIPKWNFHLAATGPYLNTRSTGGVFRQDVRWLEADELPSGEFVVPSNEEDHPGRTFAFHSTPTIEMNTPLSAYQQTEHDPAQEVVLLQWEVTEPQQPTDQPPVDYLPLEVFRLWIERDTPQAAEP